MFLSMAVGGLLFIADFSFVFAFQGYLREIGLVPEENVKLPTYYPKGFLPCLLIFLGVGCLKTIGLMFKSFFSNVANQTFLRTKRQLFFQYAIHNAQKLNTHEMMSLTSDTLARCSSSIIDLTGAVISSSTALFLFLGGLTLAPKEMILGILLAGLILFPIRWLSFALDRAGKGLTDEWNRSNKILFEGMKHNYFLKAHGLENNLISQGLKSIKGYEYHYRNSFIYSSFRNGLPGVWGIILIGILSYVSINIFKTEGAVLISFLYLFMRLAQATSEFVAVAGSLQLNLSSIDSVLEWEKKAKLFLENKASQEGKRVQSEDSFSNIKLVANKMSFSYGDDEVIKDLSFSIDTGDIMIIRGESGVGKSTLISLLMGMNKVSSGEILLNDSEIGGQILSQYQNKMAYVGPESFLFEGSIKENLLFGNPKADSITDEDIFHILDKVNLKSFVEALPEKLNHKFDEHVEASTGQKQRLSLARAILRNPKFLILDEATANLDLETEQKIVDILLPLLKNITTVVITHKGIFSKYGTKFLTLEKNYKYSFEVKN